MSQKTILDTVDQILNQAKEQGVVHLYTEDQTLDQNIITLNGKKHVNFGSCSYLGLEFNKKIQAAAKEAIDSYGTQFSSSRAYLSPRYYESLETKLDEIFQGNTMVAPTTTLGHIATIPVVVEQNDAVILDHQVHNSVQTAVNLVKAKKVHVELLRHNRMDLLEERIIKLKGKYDKIWYMADGIYSMYGDPTPLNEVYELLEKYPQLHFYVDDAHGMSCFGSRGQGYVLSKKRIHERMIVATSLNKAFASGGGAFIFPNKKIAQKVRNCGGPMITSGPMQPSALGAANAVADMHLSGEIKEYHEDLHENIKYTSIMLKKYNLPNLGHEETPIFFIAVSLPKIAYSLINRLKKDGYFLNLGIFPAVPIKNTGVRFTITRLHTFDQIEKMVKCMAFHFNNILKEEGVSIKDIYKAFRIQLPEEKLMNDKVKSLINHSKLAINQYKSINEVNREKWNSLLGDRGTFDVDGLKLLEESFTTNKEEYQNWSFNYLLIDDPLGQPVLATFLTTSISKDDMFADREVSREIENRRAKEPNYMTSKTLSIGSPISEGNHIYINRKSEYWKEALNILFDKIAILQEENNISSTIIRDLPTNDKEMDSYMMNNGFFKINMPDNLKITEMNWNTEEEFYSQLSKKNKMHYRRNIRRNKDQFELSVVNNPSEKDLRFYYDLYLNVKSRSLDLNTFELPFKLFKNIAKDDNWEILSLYLKANDSDILEKELAAIVICHKGKNEFSGLIAGINYTHNRTYHCYRQMLASIIRRGRQLDYSKVALGYTSTIEKKHFGAKVQEFCAYMQIKDNYNLEAIGTMTTDKKREYGVNERRVLSI